jgi:hypothetical protein
MRPVRLTNEGDHIRQMNGDETLARMLGTCTHRAAREDFLRCVLSKPLGAFDVVVSTRREILVTLPNSSIQLVRAEVAATSRNSRITEGH